MTPECIITLLFQAERRAEEFGLPEMVQQYHSLFPLEDLQAAAEQPSAAFGVCTVLLRAASPQLQGQAVTLRRLDPRQVCVCLCSNSVYPSVVISCLCRLACMQHVCMQLALPVLSLLDTV